MITDSKPERPATDLQILCFSIVTGDIFKSTVNPTRIGQILIWELRYIIRYLKNFPVDHSAIKSPHAI